MDAEHEDNEITPHDCGAAPDFFDSFMESLAGATTNEKEWCLEAIFGPDERELVSDRAELFRTSLHFKARREAFRNPAQEAKEMFCQTPTAGPYQDEHSGDPKRQHLTDSERGALKGVLFDLRMRVYDDDRLSKWPALQRFQMGNSVDSLAGELHAIAASIGQLNELETIFTTGADPEELRTLKRMNAKARDAMNKRAGELVLKAMTTGEVETFKELHRFMRTVLDRQEIRSIKINQAAGRGWKSHNIKTALPVAFDRVICRRCPTLAGASGQTFTPGRITREELNKAVEEAQHEAGGHPGKIDSSELSKWIKRLGLRDFMPPDARGAPRKGGK